VKGVATPTLKDVAARAGVSFKTVSNVINNRMTEVSPDTQERVRDAIEALHYRPNIAARHLRRGRANVLALVIPDLDNPYFTAISGAVISAAAAAGYTVLLDPTRGNRDNELLISRGLSPHLLDGIILNPLSLDVEDIESDRVPVPIVLLGERLIGAPRDHVVMDNVAAARLATMHLLGLGRRRIAVLSAPKDEQDAMPTLRVQGYRTALAEAGVPIDPSLLDPVPPDAYRRVDGMQAIRRVLASGRPFDAVLCMNDMMALGAMAVLREEGVRIPDDIAVVGFDDIEEGRYATPPLTTIAPDKEEIGRLVVSLLRGRIEGTRTGPPGRFEPPYQLVVRESTVGRGTGAV